MKKLLPVIAGVFLPLLIQTDAIAGDVRIVDRTNGEHCLSGVQIATVGGWLAGVTPGWAKVDLIIVPMQEQPSSTNSRFSRENNARIFAFWNEQVRAFQSIFQSGRIPIALTCAEKFDYTMESKRPGNVPEMPWLTNTNRLVFKGIRIAGTDAYLSIPSATEVISAQDILNIF